MDIKSDICMTKNGKEAKHTRNIYRRMHLVINGEEWNFHKTVWYERGMHLSQIGTNNGKEDELNPRLGYSMVRLDNQQNSCQIGVTEYRTAWRKIISEWLNCIELRTQLNAFEMFLWV